MRRLLLTAVAAAAAAVSVSSVGAVDPDHHPQNRKRDRDAPYDIDDTTWAWIPALIGSLFTVLMLMSIKSEKWLDGLSLRLWLIRYISIETLYNTLKGATKHEWVEQYRIELGHQAFTVFGILLLIVNVLFNPNADQRYAMAVLTYLQIFSLVLNVVLDMILIKCVDRVDVVRSVNTKLRFSHCIYQVILFCTDFIGGSLHLPVDCFVWATVHYTYEAVGLALEGLNVIGMSEFAIIAIVNAQILGTDVAATGWTCAFGMSSLFMSVVSIIGGQVFKWRTALKGPRPVLLDGGAHRDAKAKHLAPASLHTERASVASSDEQQMVAVAPTSFTLTASADGGCEGSHDEGSNDAITAPLLNVGAAEES